MQRSCKRLKDSQCMQKLKDFQLLYFIERYKKGRYKKRFFSCLSARKSDLHHQVYMSNWSFLLHTYVFNFSRMFLLYLQEPSSSQTLRWWEYRSGYSAVLGSAGSGARSLWSWISQFRTKNKDTGPLMDTRQKVLELNWGTWGPVGPCRPSPVSPCKAPAKIRGMLGMHIRDFLTMESECLTESHNWDLDQYDQHFLFSSVTKVHCRGTFNGRCTSVAGELLPCTVSHHFEKKFGGGINNQDWYNTFVCKRGGTCKLSVPLSATTIWCRGLSHPASRESCVCKSVTCAS